MEPDQVGILSVLIMVQSVCKDRRQTTNSLRQRVRKYMMFTCTIWCSAAFCLVNISIVPQLYHVVQIVNFKAPRREKICFCCMRINTVADQTAHLRSLISAFVTQIRESKIFKLAASISSVLQLPTVAEPYVA